jgi:cytochrome P450
MKRAGDSNGLMPLPRATVLETIGFISQVFIPTVAKGPIIRRPKAVAVAERFRLDDRAVQGMQRLHDKHPTGPLFLRIPFQRQAIILSPEDVHHVLNNSPDPFSPASSEKRAALAHFEPKNVLISGRPERSTRRALQEQVLDSQSHVHRLAEVFLPMVQQEAEQLLRRAQQDGELAWDAFIESWYRLVRRVVFGDAARDDHELTDMLARLRSDANRSFLKPRRQKLRRSFLDAISKRLEAAEEPSLAFVMAKTDKHEDAAPADQVPQWLFAFDPAGMATFRTLAVLSTHPEKLERARGEIQDDESGRQYLPYLRSCMLETLRLWPTSPLVLRETTRECQWGERLMPAECGVLIYAPYFHRDDRNLAHAHTFEPEQWLDGASASDWPIIPFSEGPAACPGRHLVLMLTSAMLAYLVEEKQFLLTSHHQLADDKPLPGTLDNYALRFSIRPRSENTR